MRTRQSRYKTVGHGGDEGATGSFCSARGIGSQASVGAAVDEERWAGKTKSSIFDSYVPCVDVRCF